jgi:hypothetical protein
MYYYYAAVSALELVEIPEEDSTRAVALFPGDSIV